MVYAAGLWLQLVIFARLGGPAAVGTYAFALALTAPVLMLSNLQLRMLLASDVREAFEFREYRRLRALTTVAALVFIAGVATATGEGRAAWPVLVPTCAMRAADALSDIYYGLWQRHERMDVIGWGLVINAVGSLAFMALLVALGSGAPGAAAGAALGSGTALVFVHLRTAWDPDLRRRLVPAAVGGWRRLLRVAIGATPLGIIVLLGSLQQNVPRYFIQHFAGREALGLFAAASQLTSAGALLVGALGAAATPRVALLCASGDAAGFRALARKLVWIGALLGVAALAFFAVAGRTVMALLYRSDFASQPHVLLLLSAAAGIGFVGSLLGYVLTAARVIAIQPVLLAASLGVAIVLCAVLVPRFGGTGAGWALVAASAVQTLWSGVALNRFQVDAAPQRRPAVQGA